MKFLSEQEQYILSDVAAIVQADANDLYKLINFESGFNPFAENKASSARGLIQFIDSTARELGYYDSQELVEKNPTVIQQLSGPVKHYLSMFAPLDTKQKLYLSVFYPAAMNWELDRPFPDFIQRVNPGIITVRDYINRVDRLVDARTILLVSLSIGAIFLYTYFKILK